MGPPHSALAFGAARSFVMSPGANKTAESPASGPGLVRDSPDSFAIRERLA
jgi:hypothetical protein